MKTRRYAVKKSCFVLALALLQSASALAYSHTDTAISYLSERASLNGLGEGQDYFAVSIQKGNRAPHLGQLFASAANIEFAASGIGYQMQQNEAAGPVQVALSSDRNTETYSVFVQGQEVYRLDLQLNSGPTGSTRYPLRDISTRS